MSRLGLFRVSLVVLLLGLTSTVSAEDLVFAGNGVYSVGDSPRAVIAADFTGDGLPDLATANAASNSISVLVNDIEYQNFQEAQSFAVGIQPTDMNVNQVFVRIFQCGKSQILQ